MYNPDKYMSRYLHISPKEIEFQAGMIYSIVARNESGVVVCYPGCKIDYNLSAYLESGKIRKKWLGQYHNRFIFVRVGLTEATTEVDLVGRVREAMENVGLDTANCYSIADLMRLVMAAGRELYIFLIQLEPVAEVVLQRVITPLHRELLSTSRLGVMLFTETNIHEPTLSQVLSVHYKLLQNVRFLPVYSHEESIYFLGQLADDFGLTLTEELKEELFLFGGGYLWWLRGILRSVLDNPHLMVSMRDIYENALVQMRVGAIWHQLTDKERQTLEVIVRGSTDDISRLELQHLITIGVVVQQKTKYEIGSKLLADFVLQEASLVDLEVKEDGAVLFEQRKIDGQLTEREKRLLQLFLEKRGVIVTREEMAQTIWQSEWEEKYSDWALDKMISRLRKVLVEAGIPKHALKTKKGQGVVLR